MPYLRVENGELYYQRVGEGPSIVFINDWVLAQTYWQYVVQSLSSRFCCVVYDPRGAGQSRSFSPNASYSIEAHADDLHRLIASLRSGLVHLVAHGTGAIVAGLCLKAHPQDVRTLSLITAQAEIGPDEEFNAQVKFIQSVILLRRLTVLPGIRGLVLRRYALGQLPSPARSLLAADFAHLDPRAAWETIGTALDEQSFSDYLAGVVQANVPVLLVACGEDKLAPVEQSRKLFARINRGRLVTMHSAGHFPMLELPPKFSEVLRNFLDVTAPAKPEVLSP